MMITGGASVTTRRAQMFRSTPKEDGPDTQGKAGVYLRLEENGVVRFPAAYGTA